MHLHRFRAWTWESMNTHGFEGIHHISCPSCPLFENASQENARYRTLTQNTRLSTSEQPNPQISHLATSLPLWMKEAWDVGWALSEVCRILPHFPLASDELLAILTIPWLASWQPLPSVTRPSLYQCMHLFLDSKGRLDKGASSSSATSFYNSSHSNLIFKYGMCWGLGHKTLMCLLREKTAGPIRNAC